MANKKYIEREAAKSKSFRYRLSNGELSPPVVFASSLDAIPAADVVEVRHGQWIKHYIEAPDPHDRYDWQCSICETCNSNQTNYCPNCGARMDGDGE